MHRRVALDLRWLAFFLLCLWGSSAHGVIFDSTGDPTFNTTAPGGSLTGSGWQYQGLWGGFLGTPVAPQYFVTAKHVGGTIGQDLVLNGVSYTTVAVSNDPNSDLSIWKIATTFPSGLIAPLYTAPNEVGQSLVVFGRGRQRGTVVTDSSGVLHGWLFGDNADFVERWGTNQVSGIFDGGAGLGLFLRAEFDHGLNSTECDLSQYDSAGAVFIKDPADNIWKLAGINYAIDGPYKNSPSDPNVFDADLFDQTEFYYSDGSPAAGPGAFYASRISSNLAFIRNTIGVPEPVNVVSRKIQGAASFDIDLPTTGSPGVECRTGGGSGVYQVVMTFANTISVAGASVSSGTGGVSNFSVSGAVATVNLTGVTTDQWIVITLAGVNDGVNTGDTSIAMGVLIGDTTADGFVNSADISQTKSRSGQAVSAANFRADVTADGSINSADISLVKSKTGTALP